MTSCWRMTRWHDPHLTKRTYQLVSPTGMTDVNNPLRAKDDGVLSKYSVHTVLVTQQTDRQTDM